MIRRSLTSARPSMRQLDGDLVYRRSRVLASGRKEPQFAAHLGFFLFFLTPSLGRLGVDDRVHSRFALKSA